MLIRRMKESDIAAVVELTLRNYDGVLAEHHSAEVLAELRVDVTPQALREQMDSKQVFVAEDAGEVVATGALADYGTSETPKNTVSQFYVRPDLQGRGIGKQLLASLIERAPRRCRPPPRSQQPQRDSLLPTGRLRRRRSPTRHGHRAYLDDAAAGETHTRSASA